MHAVWLLLFLYAINLKVLLSETVTKINCTTVSFGDNVPLTRMFKGHRKHQGVNNHFGDSSISPHVN